MSTRHAMAIDIGPRRVRALAATMSRGRLTITRWRADSPPVEIDADDAEQLGAWIGQWLRQWGFPRSSAIIALGREHVVLKRMTLPTIDDAELPGMTRLTMQRDLPFDADDAVIDFLPLERTDHSTTIVAIAAPKRVIDFLHAVAKAASLNVGHISLRALGAVGLLERTDDATGSTLLIDALGESIEFMVMEHGSIRSSRSAPVPPPQDRLSIAEAVITESRRTWMSHIAGTGNGGIASAVLLGDARLCDYATEPLTQILGVPVQPMREHPNVHGVPSDRASGDEQEVDIDGLWSLAGLLLQSHASVPMIDLANPRRAPDVAAKKRKLRLLAAGLAVVAMGLMWTVGRQHLASLEREAKALQAEQRAQTPKFDRFRRDHYKLEHLKQWESATVNWLDHASYLTSIAPSRDRLVLDSWAGTLSFNGVKIDSKTNNWIVDQQLTIEVAGEARDRETADRFREALVQSKVYGTGTPGADARGGQRMPFGFTYRLRAKDGSLPNAAQATSPDSKPMASAEPSS